MITSRARIQVPSDPVVALATMQTHLRLDTTGSPPTHPEDALIEQYVAAATREIDGMDGWLGRALMPQRYRITLDRFPCDSAGNPDGVIFLPYPPLISVDAVSYLNSAGTSTPAVEGTDYEVHLEGNPHGFIAPLYLQPWPVAAGRFNAVTIEFTCGYDVSASPPNPLPEQVTQFVMVCAATMYEQREDLAININTTPVRQFRDALQTLRVYGP